MLSGDAEPSRECPSSRSPGRPRSPSRKKSAKQGRPRTVAALAARPRAWPGSPRGARAMGTSQGLKSRIRPGGALLGPWERAVGARPGRGADGGCTARAPAAAANWASGGRSSAHVQAAPEFHFVTFKRSARRPARPGGARPLPPATPAAPPPQVRWEGGLEQRERRPPPFPGRVGPGLYARGLRPVSSSAELRSGPRSPDSPARWAEQRVSPEGQSRAAQDARPSPSPARLRASCPLSPTFPSFSHFSRFLPELDARQAWERVRPPSSLLLGRLIPPWGWPLVTTSYSPIGVPGEKPGAWEREEEGEGNSAQKPKPLRLQDLIRLAT